MNPSKIVMASHVNLTNLPNYRGVRCCGTCGYGSRKGHIVICKHPRLGAETRSDGVVFQNYTYTHVNCVCDWYTEAR